MATETFSLEHAEDLIADLRGQVDKLSEILATGTLTASTSATLPDGSVWTAAGLAMGATPAPTSQVATADAWHSLGSPSATGYTSNHGRYRMSVDGDVEFDITLVANVGGGTAGNYAYANTLLASPNYRPAFKRAYPIAFNDATSTTGGNFPCLVVDTTGQVNIRIGGYPAGVVVGGNPRMPLD
jgi:hypothetical protein